MRASNLIITTLFISLFAIGCSSSKDTSKTTGEDKQEKSVTENNQKTEGKTVEENKIVTKETVSKGDKEDPREKILADAVASYPDSLIALITRTPCYGRCPAYTVKMYVSGYSSYEGKSHTEMIGTYTGSMSKESLASIVKKVDDIKFFDMNNIYDTNVTDFPSVHVYANQDGKRKQIIDRQGGPKELKELEILIDEMVKGIEWTKK
ncbi:MAG: hypothetical protein JKY42_02760 [Flavobacteriales bacterium]|nr:hypothetical protein [Flavobacteriales bacterium]